MARVNGGDLVVRALQAAGVDAVFGLHGAHIDTIFQACLDHNLPLIDCRHEAAACHAAEGYARAKRRLGAAVITAGGGFTNAITSIANAHLDRTPVLYLTASGTLRDDDTNTLQAGIDQVAIATPITKWAHRIVTVDQIPRAVAQAVRIATSGPRGPVLLDFPWDVLMAQVDEDLVLPTYPMEVAGGTASADMAAHILNVLAQALRPLILVGSEAAYGDGPAQLARFASATGIPVFADFAGLGQLASLPDNLRGGLVQALYGASKSGQAADAILMLGCRFGLNTGHGTDALLAADAKILHVDPGAGELGKLRSVALAIKADVGPTLSALADLAGTINFPDRSAWQRNVRDLVAARRSAVAAQVKDGSDLLHPFRAVETIVDQINENIFVVADGALTYLWLSEVISDRRSAGFATHGYLGSMGVGFGTALGAQAALTGNGQRTILVTGDGAVGFSIAEFDSLVRHRLPVIVIILNNRSWGATLHFQQVVAGPNRVTGTRLENGRYHDVAAGFGVAAHMVTDAGQLKSAIALALADDRPACINVMVDLDPFPPEELILIGMDPFAVPAQA